MRKAITALLCPAATAIAPVYAEDMPPLPDDAIIFQSNEEGSEAADEDVIRTPTSITIIPSERFERMGALTLQDSLRYSAGVRTEAYGLDPRGDFGFIRGIDPARYQDGLRRTFGFRSGPRPEIFTLSRIEILRGPPSMLFGQSSTGGLINLISKKPSLESAGEIFTSYGSYDRKEIGIDVTGPLTDDNLAARMVALWRESDTQTDFVGERRLLLNPSLTWQPGPDTQILLMASVQDDKSGWPSQFLPYAATLGAAPDARLPWSTNLGEPDQDRFNVAGEWVSASLSHQFSHIIELRHTTRQEWFRSNQQLHFADFSGGVVDPFLAPEQIQGLGAFAGLSAGRVLNRLAFSERYSGRVISSDTQLQFDFATSQLRHKLIVGIDFTRFTGVSQSVLRGPISGVDAEGVSPIDAFAPQYGASASLDRISNPRQRQRHIGYYLQGQSRAYDRIILIYGLRHERSTNSVLGALRIRESKTSARAGIMVDAGSGVVPYFGYSESFQPIAGADLLGQPFRAQRGSQQELGVKWQPGHGTMLTLAGYRFDDRNRLVADPGNVLNAIQAGAVRTRGVEVEAVTSLPYAIDLTTSYSYARARDMTLGGRQFEAVPRHLASIWGTKLISVSHNTNAQLGVGARYVGKSNSYNFSEGVEPLLITTPDYWLVDTMAAIVRGAWTISINGTNIFDRKYYTSCLGRGDCYLGQRRTVNAALSFRF